jgi:hypothetical protein
MKILKREKLYHPRAVSEHKVQYLCAMVAGPDDKPVIVRAVIEKPMVIEEIIIFEDEFEGRPAVGGLFVGRAIE